jgi:hypothetical protein
MALAAAQVVDALAALLVPMAATGGRVYTSRLWPLAEADLPAWRVTAGTENTELVDLRGDVQEHALEVLAECSTRAVADIDDALHALTASGLALLFATVPPPYGLQLQSIERELATEGEAAVGRVRLRLAAVFHTAPSAPETFIN